MNIIFRKKIIILILIGYLIVYTYYKNQLMGYLERLVVGLIITISAYSLFEGAIQRNNFHNILTDILSCFKLEHCYDCIENIRIALSALVFTAGITLIFDIATISGIFAESILLGIQLFKLKDAECFCGAQIAFVHLLLLIVLLNNYCETRQQCKEVKKMEIAEKPQERKQQKQKQVQVKVDVKDSKKKKK